MGSASGAAGGRAGGCGLGRAGGWGGGHAATPAALGASRRSTYLAITSTSRLTGSPARLGPAWSGPSVVGISETEKPARRRRPPTVRRDAVDRDRALLDDVAGQRRRAARPSRPPSGRRASARGSCRCRRRGPARCGRRTGRAAAIGPLEVDPDPGRSAPRLVRLSVSAMTSAVKLLVVVLDDGQADAVDRDRVAVAGVADDERAAHGEPGGVAPRSMATTSPSSSTIPVNISAPPWGGRGADADVRRRAVLTSSDRRGATPRSMRA